MTAKPSSHSEYQFISSFLSGSDIPPVLLNALQKCVQNTRDLLAVEDCSVVLFDTERARLVALAPSRPDRVNEQSDQPSFSWPEAFGAKIVNLREPLILPDLPFDAQMQTLQGGKTRTLVCLPLFIQEQRFGILIATSPTAATFFQEKSHLFSLLAEQVALTIVNVCREEQIHDANRMKAKFLSLVTHELRSPLNAINGYLDLALAGMAGELNEQQKEFIQRARAGSEHLYALVEDLLLAARTEAGQLRLNREIISLQAIVTDMLENLELTIQDSGVILEVAVPTELPLLFVDAVRLQQALRNLLGNALHFTPAGGHVAIEACQLPTQTEQGREIVEVRIRDTGCGIAPEYHERIFERFVQAPRADSGRTTGQGLGLAVVRTIVEMHGGRIWVESVVSEGSTFIFTLDALRNSPIV
jgi:signal transduction histidine kinase